MKNFRPIKCLIIFALCVGGAFLLCLLNTTDRFSLHHISDGLFIAAAIAFLFSFEFMHTFFGAESAQKGSTNNAYYRVKSDMEAHEAPKRLLIPEYAIAAAGAALAGLILALLA